MASGVVTYPSIGHPAMRGDDAFLVAVRRASSELMKYMKTPSSDMRGFLDCHDWTKAWVETITNVKNRLQRHDAAVEILDERQVQIGMLRTDGKSEGEHVALLVDLTTRWLLIDHTHNQFDVPIDVGPNRSVLEKQYPAVWGKMETYVGEGKFQEQVVMDWLKFLAAKRFLRQVHNSGIKYHHKHKNLG